MIGNDFIIGWQGVLNNEYQHWIHNYYGFYEMNVSNAKIQQTGFYKTLQHDLVCTSSDW